MQIEFSKEQYLNLLKLVYLGNWMANANRIDDKLKNFDEAEDYIFSFAKEFGFPEFVDDEKADEGKYFPTRMFEEDTEVNELIENYDNETFWQELPHYLGDRDFAREYGEEKIKQIFKRFSERLSAIRNDFEKNQIDLTERIKKYYEWLNDIKKKGNEEEELGLNLREYGLYVVSEEFVKNFKEPVFVEFIKELTLRLDAVLDDGWQESSKRDECIKDVKRTIQEMLLKDYSDKLEVNDFHKYLNRLVDIVIKKF